MPIRKLNLLSLQEAMDMLEVSRSTFDRWRKYKGLPYRRIGKEIWIEKNELEQWVLQHSFVAQGQRHDASGSKKAKGEAVKVRIGYQSRSAQVWTALLMKELGWLEEELASIVGEQGTEVQWIDASSGPELVQQLLGGSVHIASLGDYPIALSFSLSRLFPFFRPVLLAFDGKSTAGEGISLVIRNDIHIRHLSEFADLPLSAVAQSASGCRLVKLMRAIGVDQEAKLRHQELDESLSGIMKRHIAGSVLTEPYISLLQHHGAGRVMLQEGMTGDFLTGIVADEQWVEKHSGVALAYVKAHIRVHHFLRTDPVKASQLIARMRGLPAEVVSRVIGRIRWDAAIYEKDMKGLELLRKDTDQGAESLYRFGDSVRHRSELLLEAMEQLKLPTPDYGLLRGEWTHHQLY